MELFTLVKAAVTTRQAAEFYGLQVNPHGMTCCPFHHDQHPSMKVDRRYYCFACHETGDVIDFVGKMFNLCPYDAAKKIAKDFGIWPGSSQAAAKVVGPRSANENSDKKYTQRARESRCAAALIGYESLLKNWRVQYAPKQEDAEWDRHFTTALMTLPQLSYLIGCLYSPDAEERSSVANELMVDGTLNNIISLIDSQNERGTPDERAA